MQTTFLLNGEEVTVETHPTLTLLDWLREDMGLTGTKEGCNEGDCGACSVMVTDENGAAAFNSCILFMPQLAGKAVRTVEGIAAQDGTLHPVQEAMIEHHGSQCGFCTPGFITTMAADHTVGESDHATSLAGNLCRCTGYAPILRAAKAAEKEPVPQYMKDRLPQPAPVDAPPHARPETADALAEWYTTHPEGTLVAGATDVGLWVNKDFRDLGPVAFLNRCQDLKGVSNTTDTIRIGAATTLTELHKALASLYPDLGELIRRYGSRQVRNAATIGGNIANGSPIGDGSPALIALGATLHLRKGNAKRALPLEDFFIEYGKQDRAPSEFVEAISFPNAGDHLRCFKISKRFDQDISAVCGCFWIKVVEDTITEVRLAYGGMAGTPKRATLAEQAMRGQPWDQNTAAAAMDALADDFAPLSDMRASADYRLKVAQNLLMRAFQPRTQETVLEVRV